MIGASFFRFSVLAAAFGPVLGACSLGDHFSKNAVRYNLEAEQSQDRVILLNVLRASNRRPLEFSGVQTVTGATSTQGTLGVAIPFAQNGGATASTVSPTLQMSGGPTVTVGVVDTQDFYSGLLTPIKMQEIDLFVQRGIPEGMLLNLFFGRITATQMQLKDGKPVTVTATFSNTVGDDAKYKPFQELVEQLMKAGLTTQKVDKPKIYGPLLTPAEVLEQKNLAAKAATASLDVAPVKWCDISGGERKTVATRIGLRDPKKLFLAALKSNCDALSNLANPDGDDAKPLQDKIDDLIRDYHAPAVLYAIEKSNTDYQLCFDADKSGSTSDWSCGPKKPSAPSSGIKLDAKLLSGSPGLCDALSDGQNKMQCDPKANPITLSFSVRSTYGVIYYLGEVVRRAQYPDQTWGDDKPANKLPHTIEVIVGGSRHANLFALERDSDDDSFLSTTYDGHDYAISRDAVAAGQTYEVLDLVAELIALNKSAKDLPASSVITAVGVP